MATINWRTMSADEIDVALDYSLNTTEDLFRYIYMLRMHEAGKATAGAHVLLVGRVLDAGNADHIVKFFYDEMLFARGKDRKYNIAKLYAEEAQA
jgi:hypothetical protein